MIRLITRDALASYFCRLVMLHVAQLCVHFVGCTSVPIHTLGFDVCITNHLVRDIVRLERNKQTTNRDDDDDRIVAARRHLNAAAVYLASIAPLPINNHNKRGMCRVNLLQMIIAKTSAGEQPPHSQPLLLGQPAPSPVVYRHAHMHAAAMQPPRTVVRGERHVGHSWGGRTNTRHAQRLL